MVILVASSGSTVQLTSNVSARSIHETFISPVPFHVPFATYVLPSPIVLVNVPWKSSTEAKPSLSKVPFSVNVACPVPWIILVSSVVKEPLVVSRTTSPEVS